MQISVTPEPETPIAPGVEHASPTVRQYEVVVVGIPVVDGAGVVAPGPPTNGWVAVGELSTSVEGDVLTDSSPGDVVVVTDEVVLAEVASTLVSPTLMVRLVPSLVFAAMRPATPSPTMTPVATQSDFTSFTLSQGKAAVTRC